MRKILFLILALGLMQDITAQVEEHDVSSIYIGGHIRRARPTTIKNLRASGFTTAILFNVHVDTDGTLMTDGETICKNGEYVFANTQPHYVSDIKELLEAPTSIRRIEICIGGWGNNSYDHIRDLINAHGTGEGTMLYKNFKALKEAIPEIEAVNNDQEQCYDLETAKKFHRMMGDLGMTTTIAPYTQKTYWKNLATYLHNEGLLDRILIQCYDGGAGNNPANWHLVEGVPVHGGRMYYQDTWDVDYHIGKFQDWADNCDVTGGFVWVYNDESWNMNAWASGINRVYKARTVSDDLVVATVYSETDFGGYSVDLPEGKFVQQEMACWGIKNQDVASVKVKEGYKLIIHTNSSCQRGKEFMGDNASLGAYGNKAMSITVESIENGITNVDSEVANGEMYDLQGRKVEASTAKHGIYIINKKKIIK